MILMLCFLITEIQYYSISVQMKYNTNLFASLCLNNIILGMWQVADPEICPSRPNDSRDFRSGTAAIF